MLTCHARDEVGGQGRGVSKWFIQDIGDGMNEIIGIGIEDLYMVLSVKVTCNDLGTARVGVGFFRRAEAEGLR